MESRGKWYISLKTNKHIVIEESNLTPSQLFDEFRKDKLDFGWIYGYKAMDKFKALENKVSYLEPAIQFVGQEKDDRVRSWGISVLEVIGGREAYDVLVQLLKAVKNKNEKRKYVYSRFFALKAIANIVNSQNEKDELLDILNIMWKDDDEDYLAQAGAATIITRQEKADDNLKEQATAKIKNMLSNNRIDEFWPAFRTLRALREFPVLDVVDNIISIVTSANYYHKRAAVHALGAYDNDLKVVRELGLIVRKDPDDSLRLEAVKSLARIRHPDSQEDLISALRDDNAEVRVQASKALKLLLNDEAVSIIIQRALKEGIEDSWLIHLVEALRLIDQERTLSTQVLSKELGGEDQRRSSVAEQILLDLGGWAAVQKISQRRNTLERLDKLLEQSEQAIKDTFHDTINQARRNFYFAMGVNIIIVIVGIVLVSLAIMQLIQQPEKLQTWIIPGAAGLFGILITMFFNNPRKNAREDLTTLLNVNVMFLGFLRRINQIDATFKYKYIESRSFGTADMDQTVKQIDEAVIQTLSMAQNYLIDPKESPKQSSPPQSK